ncbi:hypothetical protein [Paraburkholderia sp. BL25I1N1]|uniref:hypothetical protein n=1 Tax=Paraburkholderia sp. BL25I1N1 TaxID=1938804 RepID=UPI000D44BEA8|nr:hypothetical protein [Paraburkholderia sp. BL25I1N1]PRY04697.1 hypothetical protein B0G73_11112 [Paraburkholderia sp. BL25I1N1]
MSKPKRPSFQVSRDAAPRVTSLVVHTAGLIFEIPAFRRAFDFSFLLTVFGSSLATTIATTLTKAFATNGTKRTNEGRFFSIREFISSIAAVRVRRFRLAKACSKTRLEGTEAWAECIKLWYEDKKRQEYPQSANTLAERLNSLRWCQRTLERAGIVEKVVLPKMPVNYHRHGGRKKSLVESGRRNELCEEIVSELRTVTEQYGTPFPSDAESFIRALADEMPPELLKSDEAFRSAIQRANAQKLGQIRSIAEKALLQSKTLFECGQSLVRSVPADLPEKINNAIQTFKRNRPEGLDVFFPPDNIAESTAALLAYSCEKTGGLIQEESRYTVYGVPEYMRRLYLRLGGKRQLTAMLGGDPTAVAATILIYLVDSGDNESVALALSPTCIEETDDSNKVRIRSYKARANWSPIVDTFEVEDETAAITVPQAIRLVIEMTNKFRANDPELADSLFIFRHFNDVSVAGEPFVRNRLRILLRDNGISGDGMHPGAIRESFLIDRTLMSDGSTRIAALLAGHSSDGRGVTRGYTERWPIKILYVAKIRTFQTLLDADLVFNGLGLEKALGTTKSAARALLAQAERTGNGLRCRDPMRGAGPTSKPDNDCEDAGAHCLQCSMRLVVVDAETIEDMLRTKATLELACPESEATNALRWQNEMLPQLAFATAALIKLRRSPHAALLRKVEQRLANE